MTLPSLAKSWQFSANNAIAAQGSALADNRLLWLGIKNALIGFATLPWTVRYSCNSVTAGTAGDGVDRLTAVANYVWANEGTAHSWIVLRQTGLNATAEICLACANTSSSGNVQQIIYSPSAGFTGGTTTARPTATDELILAPGTTNTGVNTDLSIRYSVMQSTDGQCTRVLVCASGVPTCFFAFEKATNATSGWLTPTVGFFFSGSAGPGLLATGAFKHGSLTGVMVMATEAVAVTTVVNDISSEWHMLPIGLNSSTVGARGRQGTLQDMWLGSTSVASGDTYPNDSSNQFVQFGNLILPWNGGPMNFT